VYAGVGPVAINTETLEIIGAFVGFPTATVGIVPLIGIALGRARRKGYTPPISLLVTAFGCALGFATWLTFLVVTGTDTMATYALGLPLMTGLVPTVMLLVLPRRSRRIFTTDRVRFRYAVVGERMLIAGLFLVVLSMLSRWRGEATSIAMPVLMVLGCIALVSGGILSGYGLFHRWSM
jgi:hypothetical protein